MASLTSVKKSVCCPPSCLRPELTTERKQSEETFNEVFKLRIPEILSTEARSMSHLRKPGQGTRG